MRKRSKNWILITKIFIICAVLGFGVIFPQHALAQGCIRARNMSAVLGAQLSPCLQKGEWQFGASFRQSTADHAYQGTKLMQPETRNKTQVINKTKYLEMSGTYAVSRQLNLAL